MVTGWSVDGLGRSPAVAVVLSVDEKWNFVATYGGSRPDVARALGNAVYRSSGFVATLDTALLPRGVHRLALKTVASIGTAFYEPATGMEFTIR